MLGELGHYPLLVQSFIQTLKYKWLLFSNTHCDSLVRDALSEMSSYADTGEDCWLSRVRKLESLFSIPSLRNNLKKDIAGNIIKKRVKSVFDRFWLEEINVVKFLSDHSSNKLRFIQPLKVPFQENHILTWFNLEINALS